VLSLSDPRKALPKFKGKILFINGSNEPRDCEEQWVAISFNATLYVYEDGDQMVTHDSRFGDDFVATFVQELN
jgi:hypothetical protein